ncbi:MAG TPA: DUF3300 domain-containing protein [Syntrophobacteraceae bacterium]|nr:DUF3300 domain-containing protein [Syntrophobacteraceae bacterium]
MNTKTIFMRVMIGFLVLVLAAPAGTFAQGSGSAGPYRQEELDQMLAPIALYPDSLLAQILMAATYPAEVAEADLWLKHNRNLTENQLNDALDEKDWDLSVKALVPFPQVLALMAEKPEWTKKLGDAFMAQEGQVMDTIQSLRAKAKAKGNLKSTKEQKVVVRGESIEIVPANPRVVYVPTYNPLEVYGPWWYPAYPPYVYSPFYPVGGIVTAGVFGFAAGIAVGSAWNWGWGRWDWGHRDIIVNVNRNININRRDIRINDVRTASWNREMKLKHDPSYRRQAAKEKQQKQAITQKQKKQDQQLKQKQKRQDQQLKQKQKKQDQQLKQKQKRQDREGQPKAQKQKQQREKQQMRQKEQRQEQRMRQKQERQRQHESQKEERQRHGR